MSRTTAILAVEDKLSEAVSIKILEDLGIDIIQRLGLKGKSYLEKRAQNLNQTAKAIPVFMLIDLDSPSPCPPQLVRTWTRGGQNAKFFLRVAVMEVESWIMADRKGFADFLSIPIHRIPRNTDAIPQPKEFLVSLARLSKKVRLREDIVPAPGATSKVGPRYNSCLWEFVRVRWNIQLAASVSRSLKRTLERLRTFDAM